MEKFTTEQNRISEKNRVALRKQLGIYGNVGIVLHHKDETLRHTDVERYIQWNLDDVEMISKPEHSRIHLQNREMHRQPGYHISDEQKKQISQANKGRKHTEEEKRKMSENHYDCSGANNPNYGKGAAKGKHWFNNGEIETYAFDCPDGFVKGRLKRG